jgi:aminoglycoside phosphotransferase (APT) family kinase protein
MFLTEANILHYLLRHHFADLESVIGGEYHVRNLSRRNRNFRVTCGAREYLVKQPKKWDASSRQALDEEAAVYWHAKTDPSFEPLRKLLPESYGYDPLRSILVLEYLAGKGNLYSETERFAPEVARLAGSAMGTFHRDIRAVSDSSLFPRRKPWYLSIQQAGDVKMDDQNAAQREWRRVIQRHSEFAHALDSLREEWREDTAIHGDWKLENCLLSAARDRIYAIDWELASWGDPFEDIGTMLQSYWSFWVRWPSRFGIAAIRPALWAFLEGYAAANQRDPVEMAPRALRFAAARMLQTALEALDKAEKMNAAAVSLLQASLNIFTRPGWALREILGVAGNGNAR